ncbi:MAG TPA: ABC transporter substrate-binding protein [Xanthobacteraceae bacterium]|jgi:ABC-type nitrate/sulfonate/bicarbonate transport system substrate-binding protein|nr:ABC transporter substrate-binding protein [Xanthobacteraceae bacterium]
MRFAELRASVVIAALLATATTPPPASAADAIKLAAITRTVFYVPLWVAMHRGFLTDEGLDVEVTFYDNAGHTDQMLRNNEVQLVLRSPEASMMDSYRGGSLRVIAGGVSKLPHFIIAQPWIKTLDQLRGANFGVLSAKEGTTYIVQDIAKAVGLSPSDYKITVVGGSPTRWKLLQEGKIDVGLQPIPNSYEAEAAGFTNLGSAIKFVPDWQFTSVNVDEKWAEPHRDIVVRFLRALQHGRDYMRTNPRESAEIAAKELNTKVDLAVRMLADVEKYGMLDTQTALNMPGLERIFVTLVKSGDIAPDAKFDPKVFTDISYWEASHAEPAVTATIPPRTP